MTSGRHAIRITTVIHVGVDSQHGSAISFLGISLAQGEFLFRGGPLVEMYSEIRVRTEFEVCVLEGLPKYICR